MSKYYTKKVKPINNITVKVSVTADTQTDIMDRLEEQERIVKKCRDTLFLGGSLKPTRDLSLYATMETLINIKTPSHIRLI